MKYFSKLTQQANLHILIVYPIALVFPIVDSMVRWIRAGVVFTADYCRQARYCDKMLHDNHFRLQAVN